MYKSCGCSYGSCDCGVDYSKEADKAKVWDFMKDLIPQDLYMLKAQGEVFEQPRNIKNDGENVFYIGKIDKELSLDDIMFKMNLLDSYLGYQTETLSSYDKINYLHNLARMLADCVPFRSEAITLINNTYGTRYSRVISDWMKVW